MVYQQVRIPHMNSSARTACLERNGTLLEFVGEWVVIKFDIDGAEVTRFTLFASNYDKNSLRNVDDYFETAILTLLSWHVA